MMSARTAAAILDLVELDLDIRGFEEMDADDDAEATRTRETLTGLPARPGTVRR